MKLMTRNFENIPVKTQGYTVYSISTTRPLYYRDIRTLYLFTPTYEMQIEFNKTKDFSKFNENMASELKHRASSIEDWVTTNSDRNICLLCWEAGLDSCHRKLVAEAIKHAGEKAGVTVTLDAG
ncbi:MAG: DUF488 family protein [Nitrospira sp.]|nr:DUF488 family protein [Nitrospira sp.]